MQSIIEIRVKGLSAGLEEQLKSTKKALMSINVSYRVLRLEMVLIA